MRSSEKQPSLRVPMHRVNIFLSEPQFHALKTLSLTRGISYAEMIRDAVADWLVRHA